MCRNLPCRLSVLLFWLTTKNNIIFYDAKAIPSTQIHALFPSLFCYSTERSDYNRKQNVYNLARLYTLLIFIYIVSLWWSHLFWYRCVFMHMFSGTVEHERKIIFANTPHIPWICSNCVKKVNYFELIDNKLFISERVSCRNSMNEIQSKFTCSRGNE